MQMDNGAVGPPGGPRRSPIGALKTFLTAGIAPRFFRSSEALGGTRTRDLYARPSFVCVECRARSPECIREGRGQRARPPLYTEPRLRGPPRARAPGNLQTR